MQLFADGDITGEPPEPRPSWRDDCSLVLGKEVTSPFSSFIQSVTFRKIHMNPNIHGRLR